MPFKINPLTGKLDLINSDERNFSLYYIDEDLVIENKQQMIVDSIEITLDGSLDIKGHLRMIV